MSKNPLVSLLSALSPGSPSAPTAALASRLAADQGLGLFLRFLALQFRLRPGLSRRLRWREGFLSACIAFETRDGSVRRAIRFAGGRARALAQVPSDADARLVFASEKELARFFASPPQEALTMLLRNKVQAEGSLAHLQVFGFLSSLVLAPLQKRVLARNRKKEEASRRLLAQGEAPAPKAAPAAFAAPLAPDPGVLHLSDLRLSDFSISDFPRIAARRRELFATLPELCAERPLLLTRYFLLHGFEEGPDGLPRNPEGRQAEAFAYLMANKAPLIAPGDILPGTTTGKLPTGVIIYPDAQGLLIWSELLTSRDRPLNPFTVSPETLETLHHEVFPFWLSRNFWQQARIENRDALSQRLNNRFAAYFVWKTVGISHAIPDFASALRLGTRGVAEKIAKRLEASDLTPDMRHSLFAMKTALSGMEAYARNLSRQALRGARTEADPARAAELFQMARILTRVPDHPPRTLWEAVTALWLLWVGMHMENTNTGLSLGRMDVLLQPFFDRDMAAQKTPGGKKAYLHFALELVCSLMLRLNDHAPLVPDIGNQLFGGSSSDQAITLGGVLPNGRDAVCDMTYVFLKATELLALRDPNMNARMSLARNSASYLRRLCEVNLSTAATPSLHNDEAVLTALTARGIKKAHANDWVATGCVEPSIPGRHMGHTGSILLNLVAALEMALQNGRHPLMDICQGPATGDPAAGAFTDFNSFFTAFSAQLAFLIENAADFNRTLAGIHARLRPTPFFSAFTDGCIRKAADATAGGARYNTSGTANIGLSDVVDSLCAIQALVFDQQALAFPDLVAATRSDFTGHPHVAALIQKRAPRFGADSPEAVAMANRVTALVTSLWDAVPHHRNGRYTAGFWSMSMHVAYGLLSGALPSGRRAGEPFTPGLTPSPTASRDFLANLRDVAALDPKNLANNIAFNVRITPSAENTPDQTAETMAAYVKAFFKMGGMQMQFNVTDAKTLRSAMARPEDYRNLLVRISGYNAYFTTLNHDMQMELLRRAEYEI